MFTPPPLPPFLFSQICKRCEKQIYPADKHYINTFGVGSAKMTTYFHKTTKCFTCASTGVKLTEKSLVNVDGELYLRNKEPGFSDGNRYAMKPTQVPDVIDDRVGAVPDANMRSDDRQFNIAGKQAHRGTKGEDQGSTYGVDGVGVVTQTTVPDANMRTGDRKFNIAGKAEDRHCKDSDQGSNYGLEGQIQQRVVNVVKPATNVQNVNLMERRHNGTDVHRGTTDEDLAGGGE